MIMSLTSAFQTASKDTKNQAPAFEDVKEEMVWHVIDRNLKEDVMTSVDPGLVIEDLEKFLNEHPGDPETWRMDMSRLTGEKAQYYEAAVLYREKVKPFEAYKQGEQTQGYDEVRRIYEDTKGLVEEYAGACGHIGGKDHGLTPQMRGNDRYKDVDKGILSYLSQKRNFGFGNDNFKIDCTGFSLSEEQKSNVMSALSVSEQEFDTKVGDAKTMVSDSNARLFGRDAKPVADRFGSAVDAFGDALANASLEEADTSLDTSKRQFD